MRPIILPLCAVVAVVCQLHLKGEMGSPTGIVAAAAAVAAQPAAFIPVEGANLKAKLAAAAEQARRRTQPTRFWTAYSFDVRPGVAIDAQVDNFRGHMNQIGSVGARRS